MRLLVTGGAGYVGSVVAAALLVAGHRVTVLDNLSTGHRWAVPDGADFRHGDLLDLTSIRSTLAEGFDGVLHFAARSLVPESIELPTLYYQANVGATINLLDAMHETGVGRLVFSSTAATYGEPATVPIREDAPTEPTNPYGASKLAMDRLIGFSCAAYGFGAVSLRYFNVAGASDRFGEWHEPETHLIPLVLRTALGLRESISVFGTDYPTPDGSAIRDYIHIEDLTRAHLAALDVIEGGTHRIYNLGNGQGYSVRDVIATARDVTERGIDSVDAPRRPGDPPVLVASADRARQELGWEPAKPDLDTIVGDAWRWMVEHAPR